MIFSLTKKIILSFFIFLGFSLFLIPINQAHAECEVMNLVFYPDYVNNPYDYEKDRASVDIILRTRGCKLNEDKINIVIWELDSSDTWAGRIFNPAWDERATEKDDNIFTITDDVLVIPAIVGDWGCEIREDIADCRYLLGSKIIDNTDRGFIQSLFQSSAPSGVNSGKGKIYFDCATNRIRGPQNIEDLNRDEPTPDTRCGGARWQLGNSRSINSEELQELFRGSFGFNDDACGEDENCYAPLAPLPGLQDDDGAIREFSLGKYINITIQIIIGLLGIAAVIMIIIAGIQYMLHDIATKKEEAKERITNAILGLLIALGSFLILNTLNPNLLNLEANMETVSIDFGGDTNQPINPSIPYVPPAGVSCPERGGRNAVKTLALQYNNKLTYRLGGKGYSSQPPFVDEKGSYVNYCPAGTACLDCSGFVSRVLQCAGLPLPPGGTAGIFSDKNRSEKVTSLTNTEVNGKKLQPGDLLGWPPQGKKNGHVYVYVGEGQMVDSHASGGGRNPGKAFGIQAPSSKKDLITHVWRPN